MERALETKRLQLLRLVAGLLAAVMFVSVGPFSRGVSRWVSEVALSILSRAEMAAQYAVIVQARIIAMRVGSDVDHKRLLEYGLCENGAREGMLSLSNLRERLEALRALLEDLPCHGLRLLRRTEKRARRLMRAARMHRIAPSSDPIAYEMLRAWRIADVRIERPPDKEIRHALLRL